MLYWVVPAPVKEVAKTNPLYAFYTPSKYAISLKRFKSVARTRRVIPASGSREKLHAKHVEKRGKDVLIERKDKRNEYHYDG